ncbi:Proteophosphoglycan 5 [Rhodotorula toruloides ATCC 204091]|uniref:Proteophosphoglycan 5 n=1 Tax=Rhodotorula toruloides TaxID=5286 RepID=A0A0K3C7X3_RHOTO|nr:Proteophosphoglycan 5 [Rhodotorula toruloides ATCC 204091]PRQ75841.1 Proteophosphoglycan 5 [Rhodotorula toruloides]
MTSPAALFNGATLDIVLSASPALLADAPPATTIAGLADEQLVRDTDRWVERLLASKRRPALYFDERVSFHLVLSLPTSSTSPLSRAQAATLLLHSLPQPHLGLSADLSYVEGSPSSFSTGPPPLPTRTSSLTGSLAAKVPLTPAPFPALAAGEDYASGQAKEVPSIVGGGTAGGGVQVANVTFDESRGRAWVAQGPSGGWIGVWEFSADVAFVRTQFADPRLSLTVTVSLRDDPRLAVLLERAQSGTVGEDLTNGMDGMAEEEDDDYMADSYDDVNLLSALSPIASTPLHLPFSRLPPTFLPPMPPPSLPVPRPSRSFSVSHTRTLSSSSAGGASSNDVSLLHPCLGRSIRRILPIRSPIRLEMRTFPCPVGALGLAEGGRVWERDEEDGVVLAVELSAPRGAPGREGFEVEGLEVSVEGAAGVGQPTRTNQQHDLEVREIRLGSVAPTSDTAPKEWPILISGSNAQQNFLYAIARVPSAASSASPTNILSDLGRDESSNVGTVPIAVASSPTQRFTARFGAEDGAASALVGGVGQGERRGSLVPAATAANDTATRQARAWLRNVTVVVKGRPIVSGRTAADDGYAVPDAVEAIGGNGATTDDDVESPTPAFHSRWHCTLDISSFARRSPPRPAIFQQPLAPPVRPTSIAAPVLPSAALPAKPVSFPLRPASTAANVEFESVAGSKRHTMSSLASLSLKSPVMTRKGSLGSPPPPVPPHPPAPSRTSTDRPVSTRALPPTPFSPPAPSTSASASTGPKRFFSLPHAGHSATDVSNHSTSALASILPSITPTRTETPPPMSAPTGKRSSLPVPHMGGLLERPKSAQRASWVSNLVSGRDSATPSHSGAPSRTGSVNHGETSWERRSSIATPVPAEHAAPPPPASLGLGLEAVDVPRAEPEQTKPMGKVLVSVSLVPLRQAKSRRPAAFAGDASGASSIGRTNENLPPPTLPGLAPPSPDPNASPGSGTPHHAAFSFPPASPDPSSSPSGSPATPASPVTAFSSAPSAAAARALAEHTNLATSRMPRINLLDVFLVEIFVFNQSDQVKRFTVGVPPEHMHGDATAREGKEVAPAGPAGTVKGRKSASLLAEQDAKVARLVPLENDVRIGPLAPNSCASVGIRFLAIRPGSHVVEQLRLVDLSDGSETRLSRPLWVVVE